MKELLNLHDMTEIVAADGLAAVLHWVLKNRSSSCRNDTQRGEVAWHKVWGVRLETMPRAKMTV